MSNKRRIKQMLKLFERAREHINNKSEHFVSDASLVLSTQVMLLALRRFRLAHSNGKSGQASEPGARSFRTLRESSEKFK